MKRKYNKFQVLFAAVKRISTIEDVEVVDKDNIRDVNILSLLGNIANIYQYSCVRTGSFQKVVLVWMNLPQSKQLFYDGARHRESVNGAMKRY